MFEELPKNHYRVILADPPWPGFKGGWMTHMGGKKRAKAIMVEAHYPVMSELELIALPVSSLALPDSLLFLWVRSPRLELGLQVLKAWGFEFKTFGFTWTKLNSKGTPVVGLGWWTRSSTEVCLLGKRGKPARRAPGGNQSILSQRREHSRKPEEQYSRIEQAIEGPYLELFARQHRPGWDSWGLEVDKFDEHP